MTSVGQIFNRRPVEPQRPEPVEPAFERQDRGDISLWKFLNSEGVEVYFTSRSGGESRYPYASLNLGFHVGDDREPVSRNRALLASVLGVEPSRITSPYQRHTSQVRAVTDENAVGSGANSDGSRFDPCDGLVTGMRGVPLLLMFADCVPVVLVGHTRLRTDGDEETGCANAAEKEPVVAVLHAGRKGLLDGVLQNGVARLKNDYGISASHISAAIGPAIGPCCYEVEKEIGLGFEQKFGGGVIKNRKEDRVFLDLQEAAESALAGSGVAKERICILDICTSCNRSFFSYRRDGVTGRHGAIAWIEE